MTLRILATVGIICSLQAQAFPQAENIPNPKPSLTASSANQTGVYHSGWGALRPNGNLVGRVVTVSKAGNVSPQKGARVTVTMDGATIATATADDSGVFTVPNLAPGVYGMAAESTGAFAAFSFHAATMPEGSSAPVMDVYASSMSKASVQQVFQELWLPEQIVNAPMQAFEGLHHRIPAAQSSQVTMHGGVVSGQLAFSNAMNIPEHHIVKVYRDNVLIATAAVDALGQFSFEVDSAGPVNVIVGGTAYGSIGVELVEAGALHASMESKDGSRFVTTSARLLASDTLLVPVVGGGVPSEIVGPPVEEFAGPPPIGYGGGGFMGPGYGGGGGGGFGGGGGGGGLGGVGGLLGIAGLAVGVAALVSDDDGFNVNIATPVSP